MLAQLNPKIVAELQTLALSWQAVALDVVTPSAPKAARGGGRKRKPKSKS